MSQQNNRQSLLQRVLNSFGHKPAEATAPAAQTATPSPAQLEQVAPRLSSDEMYRRITDNGRCLPG